MGGEGPSTLRAWDGVLHGAWGCGGGGGAGTGTRRNLEEQTDPGPRLWRAASVPVRRNKSLSTGWTAQQRPGSARDDGDLGTAEGPEVQDRLLGARLGGTPLPQPSSVLGPQTSTCPRLRLPSLIPSTPNLGPPIPGSEPPGGEAEASRESHSRWKQQQKQASERRGQALQVRAEKSMRGRKG